MFCCRTQSECIYEKKFRILCHWFSLQHIAVQCTQRYLQQFHSAQFPDSSTDGGFMSGIIISAKLRIVNYENQSGGGTLCHPFLNVRP
mmetsp:Transcript_123178/g.213602  ORF Transcript_123178/g.213602 Transcript_123178/m.213602 type:complete len:88 (-) Transcript_123178:105-368(-)